jgi:hypothetical protein
MTTAFERFAETAKRCGCSFSTAIPKDGETFLEASVHIPPSHWIDRGTANELALGLALAMKETAQRSDPPSNLVVKDLVVEGQVTIERRQSYLWGLVSFTTKHTAVQISHAHNPERKPLTLDDLKVPEIDNYDLITVKLGFDRSTR